jgi:MarR family transcriptional regulator, negative regulator of the multidrug operon emrRAB
MDRLSNLLGATALLLGDGVLDRATRSAGRAGATGAALAVLAQEPGMSIEQLRQPLGLSQSATVRLVDSLVADGLARRSPGPDGRTVSIHLTRAGRSRARSVLVGRADLLDEALSDLSPAERDALTGLLEKVLGGLTTDRTQADRICRLCDYSTCPQQDCPVEQAACAAARTGSTAGLAQPPTGGRRQ